MSGGYGPASPKRADRRVPPKGGPYSPEPTDRRVLLWGGPASPPMGRTGESSYGGGPAGPQSGSRRFRFLELFFAFAGDQKMEFFGFGGDLLGDFEDCGRVLA